MGRLSLIRLVTYVMFAAAAVMAIRQHYVIPLKLPKYGIDNVDWHGEHAGHAIRVTPADSPNFAHSRLSGSDVIRIATDEVTKAGISEAELDLPFIQLERVSERLQWSVRREVRMSLGDGTIWVLVYIDDMSGKARLERYQHPSPKPRKPNKALEPTPVSVTPRADARVAPATVVAHL